MKHLNARSNFRIREILTDQNGEKIPLPIPGWDMRITYRTNQKSIFEASIIKGEFTNCEKDSGDLIVNFEKHKLGKGVLIREVKVEYQYGGIYDFPRLEFTPADLEVELRDQAGEDVKEFVGNILATPVAKKSIGNIAQQYGATLATESTEAINDKEIFDEVIPVGDTITIDNASTPYAYTRLSGEASVFYLSIINSANGSNGKILVIQTGLKQLVLADNIKGRIDLPKAQNTIVMLSYNCIEDIIYLYCNTVVGDIDTPIPARIEYFAVKSSDNSSCLLEWMAPAVTSQNVRADSYDLRYSNSPINPDDPKQWQGCRRIKDTPVPAEPGVIQEMPVRNLKPNTEYYFYIKSVKVNFGQAYTSFSSDLVYVRTQGKDDPTNPHKLLLNKWNLYPQNKTYVTDSNRDKDWCRIEYMIDEDDLNMYLPSGYPDTSNKAFITYWLTDKYSCNTSPFHIVIDLFESYCLDKIFFYNKSIMNFSIYGMKNLGSGWEKVGIIQSSSGERNTWKLLDFNNTTYRLLKISFDNYEFGHASTNPVLAVGEEGFPNIERGTSIEGIYNMLLYGRPTTSVPEGIMPPARRTTVVKTVDQFFCTNGHMYQKGRIHSMLSGEKVRLYTSAGQFAAYNKDETILEPYTRLADMKFRLNGIPWVKNNGSQYFLQDLLRLTYKPVGLKPFLSFTQVFSYCKYKTDAASRELHLDKNRPLDDYWLPERWKPVPHRGYDGTERYFALTEDPKHYGTMARLCYAIAAKYGPNQADTLLAYEKSGYDEPSDSGMDLLSGLEPGNELDKNWENWVAYSSPAEVAALTSAVHDGHCHEIVDEDGSTNRYGIKTGNPILSIVPGAAGVSTGYSYQLMLHMLMSRADKKIPFDVLSMHMYFSNTGNQGSSSEPIQYGITLEEALKNTTGGELKSIADFRNRFMPNKELWLTEFGWGESGARNSASKYQCYSQAGRNIDGWHIPDRHRAEVKGAWIVRASIQLMNIGFELVNYYSTECESNYFDASKWGAGAGFEMFEWDKLTDDTPGAKVEAIRQHEAEFSRGGFATTGIFGNILGNGAYPISKSYWWIATFRNRLKGFVFTGMKHDPRDSRIVIACFRKINENKGAYVVYLNDNQNTGVPNVKISIPDSVSQVKKISVYVPTLPDPRNVDTTIYKGDRQRTGWVYSRRVGDQVILPTPEENPHFPIVGPVGLVDPVYNCGLGACNYPGYYPDEGIYKAWNDYTLAWKQVEAVCDWIEYHPEGIRGAHGDESNVNIANHSISINVSEFPEIYMFDALPEPDFISKVSDLTAVTLSTQSIALYWNNHNPSDTGYLIYQSELLETGYVLIGQMAAGPENKYLVSGLTSSKTYYYKIQSVCENRQGEMSDYVAGKTFDIIPPVENLTTQSRALNSITLCWGYTSEVVLGFAHFAIYRASSDGNFQKVATITDMTARSYKDSGLATSTTYIYKMRAEGNNGASDYTPEHETRTATPYEVSPTVKSAITDIEGTKIIVGFDLEIATLSPDIKNAFMLSENGVAKTILNVTLDEADAKKIIIHIQAGTLSNYSEHKDVRIKYRAPESGYMKSAYDVKVNPFYKYIFVNVGNLDLVQNICAINFTDATHPAIGTEWNNATMVGTAMTPFELKNKEGKMSGIEISVPADDSSHKWSTPAFGNSPVVPGVEENVYKSYWSTSSFATKSFSVLCQVIFSNLNPQKTYRLRAFATASFGGDATLQAFIRSGGLESNRVLIRNNTTDLMVVGSVTPSEDGRIFMDLAPEKTSNGNLVFIRYMYFEELGDGSDIEPIDVDDDEEYDIYDVLIPVSNDNLNGIGVSFADRKYNKGLILSMTTDDASASAYSTLWALFNHKPVPDFNDPGKGESYGEYYHANQAAANDYPLNRIDYGKSLAVTDGCGNDIRFRLGAAIWPNVRSVQDGPCHMDHVAVVGQGYRFKAPYLEWQDFETLFDFGCSIYQHNVDGFKWHTGTANEWYNATPEQRKVYEAAILGGFTEDQAKCVSRCGRKMRAMAEPDGHHGYIAASEEFDDFLVMTNQNGGELLTNTQLLNVDLYKKNLLRVFKETPDIMQWLYSTYAVTVNNRTWAHFATHTAKESWANCLLDIYNFFGKEGNDDVWVATLDEVYEYYLMRRNTIISKAIENGKLRIKLKMPKIAEHYYRDITLNITGASITGAVEVSNNVYGLAVAQKTNFTQVNLDFEAALMARAEKYTAKFETSKTQNAKNDALYFVNRLKPSPEKDALIERLNPPFVHVTAVTITNKTQASKMFVNGSPKTVQLAVTIEPGNATDPSLTYESSDAAIVSISESGLLTAVAIGTATVTVTSNSDPTVSDFVNVIVEDGANLWIAVLTPGGASISGTSGATASVVDSKSGRTININTASDQRSNSNIYAIDGSIIPGLQKVARAVASEYIPDKIFGMYSNYHPTEALVAESIPYAFGFVYNAWGTGSYSAFLEKAYAFGLTGLRVGNYKLRILASTSRIPAGGVKSGNCGVLKINGVPYSTADLNFVQNTEFYELIVPVDSSGKMIISLENNSAIIQNFEYFCLNLVELSPVVE